LTQSTVDARGGDLVPLGGESWSMPLKVCAFKARGNRKRAVTDLWSRMAAR
jgi:hypothetical protein